MLNISDLKCKMASAVYSKMIKQSYGITDCCGQYEEDEVDDLKLTISLYCSGFNIEELRNGPKDPEVKKPNRIKIKPKKVVVHTQASSSDTWTIIHNLGYNPNVTIFNEDNEKISGIVTYLDSNVLQIVFSSTQQGKAYIS